MEYADVIKSDIVSSKYDVLWDDISSVTTGLEKRPVLILVTGCEAGSEEDAQLQKMLGACKLSTEKYNVIRMNEGQQIAWHQLREKLDPKFIFLIGALPAWFGISALFNLNSLNSFNDRIWLPTLSISQLEKEPSVKTNLWNNGMKPLFVEKKYGDL
jgi:hypothetical protein